MPLKKKMPEEGGVWLGWEAVKRQGRVGSGHAEAWESLPFQADMFLATSAAAKA